MRSMTKLLLLVVAILGSWGFRVPAQADPDPGLPDSVIIDMACAQRFGNDSLKVTIVVVSDEKLSNVYIPIYYLSPGEYWRADTAWFISDRWAGLPISGTIDCFESCYELILDTAKYVVYGLAFIGGIPPGRDTICTVTFVPNPAGDSIPGPLTVGFTDIKYGYGLQFNTFDAVYSFRPEAVVLLCDCADHGDCTSDGKINPIDVVSLVRYTYQSGPEPPHDATCPAANRGDFDCNGQVGPPDVVKMVNHVYKAGPGPCNPCSWENDFAAPAAVTDLAVAETGPGALTVGWTAPGDDGDFGAAAAYDIRYSDSPITEDNWVNATQIAGEPTPRPAGTHQTVVIPRLTGGQTYYFALKSMDEASQWSGLSNNATGAPTQDFIVAIPDPNLQSALMANLGKTQGDLYASELLTVSDLYLRGDEVTDLTGLQYCTNLWRIDAEANNITDLGPLAGLGRLTDLMLGDNDITDLTPLAGLTSLKLLTLLWNNIEDITPLAGLVNLKMLFLQQNSIHSVSALVNLTALQQLQLNVNQISDIAPLVANSGLGSGDVVDLRENPLSQQSMNEYIPALLARGVTVRY